MPRTQFKLTMTDDERNRLAAYRDKVDAPTLSAAIRHALWGKVFTEHAKEGRPVGYSPKQREEAEAA